MQEQWMNQCAHCAQEIPDSATICDSCRLTELERLFDEASLKVRAAPAVSPEPVAPLSPGPELVPTVTGPADVFRHPVVEPAAPLADEMRPASADDALRPPTIDELRRLIPTVTTTIAPPAGSDRSSDHAASTDWIFPGETAAPPQPADSSQSFKSSAPARQPVPDTFAVPERTPAEPPAAAATPTVSGVQGWQTPPLRDPAAMVPPAQESEPDPPVVTTWIAEGALSQLSSGSQPSVPSATEPRTPPSIEIVPISRLPLHQPEPELPAAPASVPNDASSSPVWQAEEIAREVRSAEPSGGTPEVVSTSQASRSVAQEPLAPLVAQNPPDPIPENMPAHASAVTETAAEPDIPASVPPPASAPASARKLGTRQLALIAMGLLLFGTVTFAMLRASVNRQPAVTVAPAGTGARTAKSAAPANRTKPARAKSSGDRSWMPATRDWVGNQRRAAAFEVLSNNRVPIWTRQAQPILVVRCVSKQVDAFVFIESAAQLEPQPNHTVRIRFDNEPEREERWPDSDKHDALFAPDGAAFAQRLLSAQTLHFGYTPHNSPKAVAEFNVTGLRSLMDPAAKECGTKK
jgi:hypothetical protein